MSQITPAVSVILPTFNSMAYLPTAVQSVVQQTFGDWELIVVDDGSTDETRSYLSDLRDDRVHAIHLDHTGTPARVRNAGIRQARGRHVAFLDADDVWLPRKLEVQVPTLQSASECRWSYTASLRMDEAGAPLFDTRIQQWLPYDGWIVEQLLAIQALIAMPTVVVARELLEAVGGFDETLQYCEDYDLWCRLAMRSPVCVHAEPLARIRVHAASYSSDRPAVHQSWIRLYEKMGALVSNERLRRLCAARRVQHVLTLSRSHSARHGPRAAFRTLFGASAYAWRFPEWWLGIARAAIRPFMPAGLRRLYRRQQA